MKKVMRPRFYCDFCNKGGGSGGHIKRHETRCTMNPQRECGMCKIAEKTQPNLATLVALLPSPDALKRTDYSDDGKHSWTTWNSVPPDTIEALRKAADYCPACILAALRQRGIPVDCAEDFHFTEECRLVWAAFNERQLEDEWAYTY